MKHLIRRNSNHISKADARERRVGSVVCNVPAAGIYELPEVQAGDQSVRTVLQHNFSNTEQNITLCGNLIFGKI